MKVKNQIKKGVILILLFIVINNSMFAAPIIGTSTQAASVNMYDKFEISFSVVGIFTNKYDPDQIDVWGEFIYLPSGQTYRVNAFPYNPATSVCTSGYETITLSYPNDATANTPWLLRFAANKIGSWKFRIGAKDLSGITTYTVYKNFMVNTAVNNHGPISKANNRYLKYDDGTPYYPIGDNPAWFDLAPWRGKNEEGTCQYFEFIDDLHNHNANFGRLFINFYESINLVGVDFSDVDASGIQTFKNYNKYFNQKDSWQLDKIMDYAKSQNVNLLLAINSFEVMGDASFCWGNWSDYNPQNINCLHPPALPDAKGTISTPYQYFSDAASIEQQQKLIRYIVARWGYASNLLSYELMDEANSLPSVNPGITIPTSYPQDLINWHSIIKSYINRVDPNKHLVTTAWAGNDYEDHATERVSINNLMDYTQNHSYYNLDENSSNYWNGDLELSNNIRTNYSTNTFGKPSFIGETGYYSNYDNLLTDDPNFYEFHCMLWSGMFNGSMGAPSYWIHQNITYDFPYGLNCFTGIGAFSTNFPQFSGQYTPVYASTPTNDFRMSYLINQDKIYGWIQDKHFSHEYIRNNSPYETYLSSGFTTNRPPLSSNNYTFSFPVSKKGTYEVKWYNTETGFCESTQTVTTATSSITVVMPNLPGKLRNGIYGDAGFSINYICEGHWNAGVLNANAPQNVNLACDIATSSNTTVFYAGSNDSKIHNMYWNNYYWQEATLNSANTDNVRPASDIVTNTVGDVFFIATDNHIHRYYWAVNQWVKEDNMHLSIVRNDSPLVTDSNGNVYFIDSSGKVHQLARNGSIWTDLVLYSGALPAIGGSDLAIGGISNVFFTGTDSRVHIYYVNGPGTWYEAPLNINYPANVRPDSPLTTDNNSSVYFVGMDNLIHVFYYNGDWIDSPLIPNCTTYVKPGSDIVCAKNSFKIYYIANDSRIHQYYWNVNPDQWVEAVNNVNDPQNANKYITLDANENVYYIGDDHLIYASYWGCQANFKIQVNEEPALPENKIVDEKEIIVYPNPSTGIINVSGTKEGNIINVFNIIGEKVLEKQVEEETPIMDCSSLKNGIYFIQVVNGAKAINKKIIIEK